MRAVPLYALEIMERFPTEIIELLVRLLDVGAKHSQLVIVQSHQRDRLALLRTTLDIVQRTVGIRVDPPQSLDSIEGELEAIEPRLINTLEQFCDLCGDLAPFCRGFGLTASAILAARINREPASLALPRMMELADRIRDELATITILQVPAERAKYWERAHAFGDDVAQRFPEATTDVIEAGNCYAAGRHTACVFHLMRVMEHALRALATSLGIAELVATGRDRSWGVVLGKIQARIDTIALQRKGWKRGEGLFYQGAHGLMVGVKDAWRNDTMHLEAKYEEEDAKRIYDAVHGFMGHLAKLPGSS